MASLETWWQRKVLSSSPATDIVYSGLEATLGLGSPLEGLRNHLGAQGLNPGGTVCQAAALPAVI